MLLNEGANHFFKDTNGRTPRQDACRGGYAFQNKHKLVQDTIDRWSVTMTILCFKELGLFQWIDLSMIDLWEYIGLENDFI